MIGDNEVEKRTVTYRRYGQKDQVTISLDEFIEMVKKEIDQKIAF